MIDLFFIDKLIISAITAIVHSPSTQFFTLVGLWATTTVLLPKNNKDTGKQ